MKEKGRQKLKNIGLVTSDDEKTIQELKKENLKLRAELDYIKKLKALREEKSQQLKKK